MQKIREKGDFERVQITLPRALRAELEAEAWATQIPLSELLRRILAERGKHLRTRTLSHTS